LGGEGAARTVSSALMRVTAETDTRTVQKSGLLPREFAINRFTQAVQVFVCKGSSLMLPDVIINVLLDVTI